MRTLQPVHDKCGMHETQDKRSLIHAKTSIFPGFWMTKNHRPVFFLLVPCVDSHAVQHQAFYVYISASLTAVIKASPIRIMFDHSATLSSTEAGYRSQKIAFIYSILMSHPAAPAAFVLHQACCETSMSWTGVG